MPAVINTLLNNAVSLEVGPEVTALPRVNFDTNISVETSFTRSWSPEKIDEWFDHFLNLSSLDEANVPVHSLVYDDERAFYNLIFASSCALDTFMDEVFFYATISPF